MPVKMRISLVSLLLPLAAITDYSYDSTQYHKWLLNEKLVVARETLEVLDTKIDDLIYDLPGKITTAGEDILTNIRDTNHDYGSIVVLITLGRVIRIAGAVQGVTTATLSTILGSVLGPSLISASFAASRVSRLQRPELGCDFNSYVNVLKQYEVLLSLRETYAIFDYHENELPTYNNAETGRHLSQLLTPALQPSILKYNVRDFQSEMKKSLRCVLDRKTGSSLELERCIELIADGMARRLDLTSEYIRIQNEIEVVDEKYNQV